MSLNHVEFALLQTLFAKGGKATSHQLSEALEVVGERSSESALRSRISRLALRNFVVKNGDEFDLTMLGREHFLDELAWRAPESPLLHRARKTRSFVVSAEVEALDEGGYLATCPDIQGCHAEGTTVAEALENLEDAARVLLELNRASAKTILKSAEEHHPGRRLHAELVLPISG